MAKVSDLASLLGRVPKRAPYRKFLLASYADNTKRAYESDVGHFRKWGGRIPSNAMQLAQYLAHYAGKLSYATLSRRLAGVHREHVRLGMRSPARAELVRATLRGIARTYSRRQRKVRPILPAHLARMAPRMRGTAGARDKALLFLGFMGGFRRSELGALDIEDLEFGRTGVAVTLRRSKTDQDGEGRVVKIPLLRGPLCAVGPLQRWLKLRGVESGPVFTSLSPRGRVTSKRLSNHAIAHIVKRWIREIGLDASQFSGHSMRAGFVTSAARAGALAWQIKQQTGHKSDAVLAGYIRDGAAAGANVARLIGK